MTGRRKWTDEMIKEELLSSIKILMLKRMPTADELKSIGRNDLHCKISRTKKYMGWAEELGLGLSRNETRTGNEYEVIIKDLLIQKGFDVESMTTKHPFDLKVNGGVKVDVKVANLFTLESTKQQWWTFHLSKEHATCDIYICVALGDASSKDRIFVIPSHLLKMKSLNIGRTTKYERFIDRFEVITKYSDFIDRIDTQYA